MKSTVIIALLAAFVGSAATALLLDAARPAPTARGGSGAGAPATAELSAALDDLRDELRGIRHEVGALRTAVRESGRRVADAVGHAGGGSGRTSLAGSPTEAADDSGRSASAFRDEDIRSLMAPADLQRLRELERWEEDAGIRRRWLFRSDREVLEWFGTPTSIEADGMTETWYYEVEAGRDEDGDPYTEEYYVYFNRGRVTDAE